MVLARGPAIGCAIKLAVDVICFDQPSLLHGFLFLLAGYFTPASLERKGYSRFVCDRFLRLGVPLLAFILILGPLTAAIVTAARGDGFWPTIVSLWHRQRIINGPLWFAQALLIFSLAYILWRAIFGGQLAGANRQPTRIPSYLVWLLSALGVSAASFAVRQWVPTGENVFGLQLGYFPAYIFLFAVGIAAWRHDWLRQLEWKRARPWINTLVIAWLCLPASLMIVKATVGLEKANFSGGISWPAIFYALWDPFIAWGAICVWLLLFRDHMNQPSRLWDWLNRRAYAVYILHPPVLVSIALLLHGWLREPSAGESGAALIKFAVVGTLTCLATWLIADIFVRLPGVRRIV